MVRLVKILETNKIDQNVDMISDNAFIEFKDRTPLTVDFRPNTEWGDAKIHHINNALYAEIDNIPDRFKGLYLAPAYIQRGKPIIIDGVMVETNIEILEVSLTDKHSIGFEAL